MKIMKLNDHLHHTSQSLDPPPALAVPRMARRSTAAEVPWTSTPGDAQRSSYQMFLALLFMLVLLDDLWICWFYPLDDLWIFGLM